MQSTVDKEAEYVAKRAEQNRVIRQLQQDLTFLQKASSDEERLLRAASLDSQAAAERAANK